MTDFEFRAWPKTSRLFRDVIITEKIDGTNSAVHFDVEGNWAAQSRKRLITPEDDNFGFATWVSENHETLFDILGPGTHFGEWWGYKIQRGYNRTNRSFSLFNVAKWESLCVGVGDHRLESVPVLYKGVFNIAVLERLANLLQRDGSDAAFGFPNPEGVCVYHTQSRMVYKYTFDGDGHKGN